MSAERPQVRPLDATDRAWSEYADALEARLGRAAAERDAAREALRYMMAWIRHGEGDESTAAEMVDAVLVVQEKEQGQ